LEKVRIRTKSVLIRGQKKHRYTLQGDSGGPAFRIAHAGLPEASSVLVQTGIVEYGIPDGPEEHPFKCGFVPTLVERFDIEPFSDFSAK